MISIRSTLAILAIVSIASCCVQITIPQNATGACCVDFVRPDGSDGKGCVETTFGDCTASNGTFRNGGDCSSGYTCGACCSRGNCFQTWTDFCPGCNFRAGYGCGGTINGDGRQCPDITGSCCRESGCEDGVTSTDCSLPDDTFLEPEPNACDTHCGGTCCDSNGVLQSAPSQCQCSTAINGTDPGVWCNAGFDCTSDLPDGVNCFEVQPSFNKGKRSVEANGLATDVPRGVYLFGNNFCIPIATFKPTPGETCSCGMGSSNVAVQILDAKLLCNLEGGRGPDMDAVLPFTFDPNQNTGSGFNNANSPLVLNNWSGFSGPFTGNPDDITSGELSWMCFEYSAPPGTDLSDLSVEIGAGAGFPNGAPMLLGAHPATFFSTLVSQTLSTPLDDAKVSLTFVSGGLTKDIDPDVEVAITDLTDSEFSVAATIISSVPVKSVIFKITPPIATIQSSTLVTTDNSSPYSSDAAPGLAGVHAVEVAVQFTNGQVNNVRGSVNIKDSSVTNQPVSPTETKEPTPGPTTNAPQGVVTSAPTAEPSTKPPTKSPSSTFTDVPTSAAPVETKPPTTEAPTTLTAAPVETKPPTTEAPTTAVPPTTMAPTEAPVETKPPLAPGTVTSANQISEANSVVLASFALIVLCLMALF